MTSRLSTRLLLISHAATAAMRSGQFPGDASRDAIDLSRAPDQAAVAGLRERLPPVGGMSVLCGPALCARDTAAALGLTAQVDAGLADMDYGRWQGRRLADFGVDEAAQLAQWSRDPHAAPHGGESFVAVLARVGAWLDGLNLSDAANEVDGRTVVAVTHAPVVRAAVMHALQVPPASFALIEVAPLSAVELRRTAGMVGVGGWHWWVGRI
jgi:broad specificity phosphatase PhoE